MTTQNSRQYLRSLKTLHTALLLGMIAFSVTGVTLMMSASIFPEDNKSLHDIMKFVVPVVSVIAFLYSGILFKKKTDELKNGSNLSLGFRLNGYRTASLLRWVLLESAVFLSLIALLLTKEYYYAIFIFLLLVFFFLYAPSAEKIKTQLELNSQEQALLDDDYAEWM